MVSTHLVPPADATASLLSALDAAAGLLHLLPSLLTRLACVLDGRCWCLQKSGLK